ncbi:hypothetical protein OIV83_005641 [Microbotryomycetes sp. JL201]|nr:hypothetical protein OIV83_005641 [Microbotryomycetes sp. JL201]
MSLENTLGSPLSVQTNNASSFERSPMPSKTSIRASSDVGGQLTGSSDQQALDFDDDTFTQMLSIHVDQPVGSMSISPANRDVALGGRKGLWIVDLQNPYDPPRYLPHDSAWEVADVQWSPFPARSEWVASTSAHQAIVYNLSFSPSFATSAVEHRLQAHARGVTDINWSPGSPDVLATCALDGWVYAWDLRAGYGSRNAAGGGRKPVWGVCAWSSSATQVKWNRREPHIVASAHDNKVLVWDDRMGAAPLTEIQGHSAKIYGIDWSRKDPKKLVTCSLDKSFKSWNIDHTSTSLLSVHTSSPVWRARFLPFGEGVLTLPQRTDHALSIWGRAKVERGDTAEPVARFEGSREGVKEFVWRVRGGCDVNNDDRAFQLVTWSKDRRLRLWPISDEILKEVGHLKGARIDIPMTRRNAPDVSYRTFQEAPAPVMPFSILTSPTYLPKHLAHGPSLLSASLSSQSPPTPSLLTSSLMAASLPGAPSPLSNPPSALAAPFVPSVRNTATMTTTRVRTRRHRAHDRLAWMEGVKVIKPQAQHEGDALNDITSKVSNAGGTDHHTVTRTSSPMRGTDAGTAREGGDTERGDSVMSPGGSTRTGTALPKEPQHANLGEEITSAVRRFPRINFEKVHVAGRTCTVSLYSPLFIRATFHFPKNYPYSAAPAIDIERNVDIPQKSRAFLLQSIRKLMANRTQRGQPCLEQALRFLLGDRTSFEGGAKNLGEEDGEDVDDEAIEGQAIGAVAADILRNNFNVPPPRRAGAVFGPSGQLVVFFPTNVVQEAVPDRDDEHLSHSWQALPKSSVRISEAFGYLPPPPGELLPEEEYRETDEALQMATVHSVQSSALHTFKPIIKVVSSKTPTFSTLVHIKDVTHLTMLSPDRIVASLGEGPLTVARKAAKRAAELQDSLLTRVWETIVQLLDDPSAEGFNSAALGTLFAERILPAIMSHLIHLRDIQTLGIVACLLEMCRREVEELQLTSAPPQPIDDYFSHHPVSEHVSSDFDSAKTPLATANTIRSKHSGGHSAGGGSNHSPKNAWAISGLFPSSVLSMRSGTPPTPGSPDKPLSSILVRTPSTGLASGLSGFTSLQSSQPALSSPLRSPIRALHNQAQHNSSDSLSSIPERPPSRSRRSSKGRLRGSPNVTFGGTSVALIQAKGSVSPGRVSPARAVGVSRRRLAIKLPENVSLHKPPCWWMTDTARNELELIRLAYAELLYRWGFDFERLQVLKYCRSAPTNDKASDFGVAIVQDANGFSKNTCIALPDLPQATAADAMQPLSSVDSYAVTIVLHLLSRGALGMFAKMVRVATDMSYRLRMRRISTTPALDRTDIGQEATTLQASSDQVAHSVNQPPSAAEQSKGDIQPVSSRPDVPLYIAPHRRAASMPSIASLNALSNSTYEAAGRLSYEGSALPPPEDHFYTTPVKTFPSVTELSAQVWPPRSSTPRTSGESIVMPPSPLALLSLPAFPHPADFGAGSETSSPPPFVADAFEARGEGQAQSSARDESSSTSCASPISSMSLPSGGESDLDFLIRLGRPRESLFVASGIDVPSPVLEERLREQQADAVVQLAREPDVCTGCGTVPAATFVALKPCGHLVCAACISSLINATSHRPPRASVCFNCSEPVSSFDPAWNNIGFDREIGLVQALLSDSQQDLRFDDDFDVGCSSPGELYGPYRNTDRVWTHSRLDLEGLSTRTRHSSASSISSHGQAAPVTPPIQLSSRIYTPFSNAARSETGHDEPVASAFPASSTPAQERPTASTRSALSNRNRSYSFAEPSPLEDSRSSYISQRRSSMPRAFLQWQAIPSVSADRRPADPFNSSFVFSAPDFTSSPNAFAFGSAQQTGYETPITSVKRPTPAGHPFDSESPTTNVKYRMPSGASASNEIISEWPVVRIDNIPWDVTAAEIEAWLPNAILPSVNDCFLPIHILCNRTDGRTLNQCYVEAESIDAARVLVRVRDGHKLRQRPVHLTLCGQGELLSTLFPTYTPGFAGSGLARHGSTPCPLLMQTELNGLLALCKLESPHALKAVERPYLNLLSIMHKFPWSQKETWNSQQVLRLFNAACSAVVILGSIRERLPDWRSILDIFSGGVMTCPGFRNAQKARFWKKVEALESAELNNISARSDLSSESSREAYVTCRPRVRTGSDDSVETFNLDRESSLASTNASPQSQRGRSVHHSRLSSIARELDVDLDIVERVAERLGVSVSFK